MPRPDQQKDDGPVLVEDQPAVDEGQVDDAELEATFAFDIIGGVAGSPNSELDRLANQV